MMRYVIAIALSSLAIGQATVEGTIRASDGRALAAVSVSIGDVSTRTDAAGKYRFDSVRAAKCTVRAQIAGYAEASSGPFELDGKTTKQVDLTLVPQAAFFDEPNFVVAGVTDTVNRGGHGSETVVRSTEALTKAASSLAKETAAQSEESLRAALEHDPSNAELHHSLGAVEEKKGNALEAAREYQRAAELSATENNLFDWGTELLTHRAAAQASEVFAQGHRLFPGSVRTLLGLGAALYALGSYDEAAQRLFEASDLHPTDPAPYLILGQIDNAQIRQLDGFGERMERFARLRPQDAWATYYFAAILWDRQRAEQAESLLEKALSLDPGLADAYLLRGIVCASRKDFSKAIASFQKAIDLGTLKIEAHYRLGQAYQQVGDKTKAHQEFAIFEELRKTTAAEEERQRNQIQQFVFALRQ
jgi:tetratricopeptide (TPR) repeat protein